MKFYNTKAINYIDTLYTEMIFQLIELNEYRTMVCYTLLFILLLYPEVSDFFTVNIINKG